MSTVHSPERARQRRGILRLRAHRPRLTSDVFDNSGTEVKDNSDVSDSSGLDRSEPFD